MDTATKTTTAISERLWGGSWRVPLNRLIFLCILSVSALPAFAQAPCGAMGAWNCSNSPAPSAQRSAPIAAPAKNACLIVKHKGVAGRRLMWFALIGVPIAPGSKYDYVDSLEMDGPKLAYSGKDLEKLLAGGTHVIVLNDKHTAADLEDARKSCRESVGAPTRPLDLQGAVK